MLKFPSLSTLWTSLRNILLRFPLQSLIALVAMSLWLSVADHYADETVNLTHKLIALSLVAFTTSLSVALFAENRKLTVLFSIGIQILLISASYSIAWFIYPEYFKTDVLKIILLILAGHFLVSFSAYINCPNLLTFWSFNKTLFLRFFTSVLFSAVLYIGLAVALFTIESLFQFDFDGDIYYKLFIIITAGFNTLFFLDGIPSTLTAITEANEYPKALKIFSQYVLIPLLTIYLAILLIYELKIIFSMELPDGMVSILIMGYAVFGILSYLLIYPISQQSAQGWINNFSKLFFWFMLPLLILLFVAILIRIKNYGITEPRYFVFILAVWLSFITFYFLLKKRPNIKIIPISLFFACIISIVGPQSAASISKKSQQARLSQTIQSDEYSKANISIITYLIGYHGLQSIAPYTSRNTLTVQQQVFHQSDSLRNSNFQKKSLLLDTAFSILSVNRYPIERTSISFVNEENYVVRNEFDFVFWMESHSANDVLQTPAGQIRTSYPDNNRFYVVFDDTDSVLFRMDDLRNSLARRYDSLQTGTKQANHALIEDIKAPRTWMTLRAENSTYEVQIQIEKITIDSRKEPEQQNYFPYFSGYILVSDKK